MYVCRKNGRVIELFVCQKGYANVFAIPNEPIDKWIHRTRIKSLDVPMFHIQPTGSGCEYFSFDINMLLITASNPHSARIDF